MAEIQLIIASVGFMYMLMSCEYYYGCGNPCLNRTGIARLCLNFPRFAGEVKGVIPKKSAIFSGPITSKKMTNLNGSQVLSLNLLKRTLLTHGPDSYRLEGRQVWPNIFVLRHKNN